MSIYLGKPIEQDLYDKYNAFVFSTDRHIFFKMVKRVELFNKVRHLPGDIVECGVFKGSGIVVWLKLLEMYTPHDIRRVIGFDFFDPSFVTQISDEKERSGMEKVFTRCSNLNEVTLEKVTERLINSGFSAHKFELVKGDIIVKSKEYIDSHPGMRICLLYLDLDLDKPTYETLLNLWDRVVIGGIVVFDEYGYGMWSESNAVDRFVFEKKLTLHKIDLQSPTAYVVKN